MRLYKKADLIGQAAGVRVSPHDPGVKETLLALEFAGRAPREIALIGVVPEVTTMGLELSAVVQAAIPAAIYAIAAALERFGERVVTRAEPLAADAWWKIRMAGNSSAPAAAGNPSHAARTPGNS
jgi:hydrogenase maturation protease